ncbi:unnamed protein product, partial [Owenia fusiformis]
IFSKVWCARRHPIYRELDARDIILYEKMPPQVREIVHKAMCINTSGIPNSAEGADFKLETINKKGQFWMPQRPTLNDWDRMCANFDSLENIRSTVFKNCGQNDPQLISANKR